jgi:hypothetical protein
MPKAGHMPNDHTGTDEHRQAVDAEQRAAAFRTQQMQPLVGCRFVAAPGEPARLITGVSFVVDDIQLTDEGGNTFMLRAVYQIDLPAGQDAGLVGDDHARAQAARRRVPTPPRPHFRRPAP